AVSYAHFLAPNRAGAATPAPQFYNPPEPHVDVASRRVPAVLTAGGVVVVVSVEEPALLHLTADAVPRPKPGTQKGPSAPVIVAQADVEFTAAGQKTVTSPVTPVGRRLLRKGRKGVTVFVDAVAIDRQGQTGTSGDVQRLTRRLKKHHP